jgi:hypothetical protein
MLPLLRALSPLARDDAAYQKVLVMALVLLSLTLGVTILLRSVI